MVLVLEVGQHWESSDTSFDNISQGQAGRVKGCWFHPWFVKTQYRAVLEEDPINLT